MKKDVPDARVFALFERGGNDALCVGFVFDAADALVPKVVYGNLTSPILLFLSLLVVEEVEIDGVLFDCVDY